MKAKLLSLLLVLFLISAIAAPLGVAAESEPVQSTPVSVALAAAERPDWPTFDLIEGENSTDISVEPAQVRASTGWRKAYLVLIPVGVVVCGALAVVFFVKFKKRGSEPTYVSEKTDVSAEPVEGGVRRTSAKKSGVRIAAQVLTIVFAFTVLSGTGLFGIGGLLEDLYDPIYYYAGATESKNAAPDPIKGYTEDVSNREILSTFDFGLESKYDRVYSNFPHFWNASSPKHNYATVSLSAKYSGRYEFSYEEEDGDGANVWYVLAAEDASDVGENYYAEAEYRLAMTSSDGEINYVDTTVYDKLRMVFKAENADKPVNLTVIAETRRLEATDEGDLSPIRYELGTYTADKGGEKVELTFNMGVISAEDRPYLARILFRTNNVEIEAGSQTSAQKNSIYYLELYSTGKTTGTGELAGTGVNADTTLSMSSEYLGSYGYSLLGAYSASGFYDTSDKKWKIWYGAGIPENIASDNVYYMETTDPNLGWSKPVRLILNDPTGKLTAANVAPGYGGDPSVVKVNGTYYMFFSGLENTKSPPNKIYLATSQDGMNFTVYGCVVDVEKMGLGYGAGGPSVIYKDGTWYLYYYTQSPSKEYPDEPIGFVLKKGTTPYEFGKAEATYNTLGAADVKWMPTLGLWVCTDYTEGAAQGGYDFDSVRIGFSKDGVNFNFTNEPLSRPVQDYSAKTNHNPGFIGNELGYGFETMFLTYGVNDFSLRSMDAGLQMDCRMLGYSRVTFSVKEGE